MTKVLGIFDKDSTKYSDLHKLSFENKYINVKNPILNFTSITKVFYSIIIRFTRVHVILNNKTHGFLHQFFSYLNLKIYFRQTDLFEYDVC